MWLQDLSELSQIYKRELHKEMIENEKNLKATKAKIKKSSTAKKKKKSPKKRKSPKKHRFSMKQKNEI